MVFVNVMEWNSCMIMELVDQFSKLHKHMHSSNMDAERGDAITNTHINIPKVIQSPRQIRLQHSERIKQKDNRTKIHKNTANKMNIKKLLP